MTNRGVDDMIDTLAAIVDQDKTVNSEDYKLLHELREMAQTERWDANEYYDSQFGVVEDILSRAISNINARR